MTSTNGGTTFCEPISLSITARKFGQNANKSINLYTLESFQVFQDLRRKKFQEVASPTK